MAITIECLPPSLAGVFRQKDPATLPVLTSGASPRREVDAIRILRINSQTVWSVSSLRKRHHAPMLCSICRAVHRSVAIISDAAIFRAPRDEQIERAFV